MLPEERALRAAIIAHPDDDTARLVFADWLQEHDQERRAEFVRVQVAIAARRRDEPPAKDSAWLAGYRLALHREESILAMLNESHCRCMLCLQEQEKWLLGPEVAGTLALPRPPIPHFEYEWFRKPYWWANELRIGRGFLTAVRCGAKTWLEHGDALRLCEPVTRVTWTGLDDDDRLAIVGRARAAGVDVQGRPYVAIADDLWKGVTFELSDRLMRAFAGGVF